MTMTKRSMALDAELVEEALSLAGKRGFSRPMNEALRFYLQRERVETLEEELAKEYGPVTPEDEARVDAMGWPE